jgi:hypothetical protein
MMKLLDRFEQVINIYFSVTYSMYFKLNKI